MSVGAAFLQYVLEQLDRAGRVTSRRMFGGVGLYCDSVFFGLIDDDTLFFKVSDDTRNEYESRGMKPFRPYADKPEVSMSYYTVPADVLDDQEELVAWARQAVKIAASVPKKARSKTSGTEKARKTPKSKQKKKVAKRSNSRPKSR